MNGRLSDIWVYLSASPLLGLTVTLVAYQAAYWLYQRARFHPLLNPVAVTVALIATALTLTHTPYGTYFSGAQFIHCSISDISRVPYSSTNWSALASSRSGK